MSATRFFTCCTLIFAAPVVLCIGYFCLFSLAMQAGVIDNLVATDQVLQAASSTAKLLTATVETFTPTPTKRPSTTPAPTLPSGDYTVRPASGTRYITTNLNVRSGPGTTYSQIGRLAAGTAVTLTGEANGWFRIRFNNGEGWVAGSYTSTSASGQQPANSSSSGDGGNQQPAPAQSSGDSCGGARTCGQMNSCAQAYACLNAGNGRLDGDNDGVPCEDICPGG